VYFLLVAALPVPRFGPLRRPNHLLLPALDNRGRRARDRRLQVPEEPSHSVGSTLRTHGLSAQSDDSSFVAVHWRPSRKWPAFQPDTREFGTCVEGPTRQQVETLEAVGFLSEGKARKRDGLPSARHFDTKGRFGFRARLPQHGECRERFVVNLRHQKGFPAVVLLPHLTNLDFASRHSTTLDTNPKGVNNRTAWLFAPETTQSASSFSVYGPDLISSESLEEWPSSWGSVRLPELETARRDPP
jgi:hypothetical protein